VTFEGHGCTISQASADIAAELAEGKTVAAVRRLRPSDVIDQLGGTARLDCAKLGLQTLQRALGGMDDIVRVHVRLAGRVQGVGFRYATADEAERRRLVGWVRNLGSGGVEAVFQGPRAAIEDMLRWCQRGPPGSYVRDVQVDWDEPIERFDAFEIRRTAER
jgi:acylphosphatase